MKKLIALLTIAISTSVMACPKLAGQYQCYDDETGYYDMSISQKGSGTNTVYTTTENNDVTVVMADNKWRTVQLGGKKTDIKSYCKGSYLHMDALINDPNMGAVKMFSKTTLTASGQLATDASIEIAGHNYPAQTTSCTKL